MKNKFILSAFIGLLLWTCNTESNQKVNDTTKDEKKTQNQELF